MLTYFLDFINKRVQLNNEERVLLEKLLKVRLYKKGEFLIKEGEYSDAFYFNIKGLVRLYYLIEGEEKTTYFYSGNQYISAYRSFTRDEPCRFNLQAMEDTHIVAINKNSAYQLLEHSSKFEALARLAMEDELICHQDMVASHIIMTPEQRYLNLMESFPEIFQKVPQLHIASYIGVKPESLSRIKKRCLQKT
ncbi:Crp/Fnr family transcriptional regulator [Aureibacter tunicatorum]|uniref:CRP-like cAMP-binding protein n=1 Tax=Aureibacter tunicatorum TaxID=866807 RepID=A0AAE3XQS2_9BACT|nr:Crp/Fnr family transcriptional regulator [Aureibacter tunicatorum]MDR6240935.1 CRP-like cAMP-binding protein [Aureibacter tunicatorum]BDD03715.1 cyclic nucleotide-binding protein [Aureibacter tunicatorum]